MIDPDRDLERLRIERSFARYAREQPQIEEPPRRAGSPLFWLLDTLASSIVAGLAMALCIVGGTATWYASDRGVLASLAVASGPLAIGALILAPYALGLVRLRQAAHPRVIANASALALGAGTLIFWIAALFVLTR